MLFTGCFRSVVLICFYANFIYAQVAKCPTDPKAIEPCRCYPKSKQIRCENTGPTLSNAKLTQIFTNADLKGDWEILYIHGTTITSIEAEAFKNVHFTNIFISNNAELESIAPNSFTTSAKTVTIEIRENRKLKSGLFEVAKLFAESVVTIGFDGNDIQNFNDFSFTVGAGGFNKLESLNLQNQATMNTDASTTALPAKFIDKLTKLKQLSLDFIGLKTITDGAIDLSAIAGPHILVFLNNNNLDESQVTSKKIIVPIGTATVGLVLERNKIIALTAGDTGNAPLFESIAKKGGNVYLKDNAIATCTCTAVSPLKSFLSSLIHITTNPICDGNKAFETCP